MSEKHTSADESLAEEHVRSSVHASRREMLQLVGAGGIAALAGCMGGDDSTDTRLGSANIAFPEPPVTPVRGVFGEIQPYYTRIVEPLTWVTDGMETVPWLATDWNATSDTTWEFTIRDDVTFHNGESLTADEVVFSFVKYLEANEWAQGFLHTEPGGITTLDERTVEIENTARFPVFPKAIALGSLSIQHPDAADTKHEVIGTGPFQVDEVAPNQYLTTVAFDEYWRATPTVSEVTYHDIQDANSRSLSLESEELDVAFSPPRDQIESMQESDDIDILTRIAPRVGYFGINIYNSPTDDVNLRRALNYAVSQSTLVETVLSGIGEPAKGPISQIIDWSAHESLPDYEQDVERAQTLVEESDYDGEPLQLAVSQNRTDNKLLAEAYQSMAADVGVNVNIQLLEEAAYDDLIQTGEFHLRLMENGTRSGAADYILYDIYHTDGLYNAAQHEEHGTGLFNLGGEVDGLIEEGQQAADEAKKRESFESAIRQIMDAAVIVPLYNKEYVVAKRADIDGLILPPVRFNARWEELERAED